MSDEGAVGPRVGVPARRMEASMTERLLDEVGRGAAVERVAEDRVPLDAEPPLFDSS